jgi:hypothetical protein
MSLKVSFGCVSINILDKSLFIFRWNEILDKYYVEKARLFIFLSWCQVIMNFTEILFILLFLYFCSRQKTHENNFNLRSV